jgi:hypothetical protein
LEQQGDDEHFLLVHRMAENHWYSGNSAMSTSRIAIGKSLYGAVAKLFFEATSRIREPDHPSYILDGVRYYFAATGDDGTVRAGNTHSPEDGSPMWRLTKLCDALMDPSGMETVSEADWAKEIDTLVHAIRGTAGAGSGDPANGGQESAVQSLLRKQRDEGPQAIAPAEELAFEVRPWRLAWSRDLRKPVTHGTTDIPREEIIAAKDAVIADLERTGEEHFKPDLFMEEFTRHVVVIEEWFSSRPEDAGERLENRTYYVLKGKIIPEAIGKPMAYNHFRPRE